MTDTKRAYLSLGSNLGDRLSNIVDALRAIEARGVALRVDDRPSLVIAELSPVYETAPLGADGQVVSDQGAFLNSAVAVDTCLTPAELRALTLDIEVAMGRKPGVRWQPRTIDIDVVLYGEERISLPNLTVPHPRMLERAFVVRPLLDIDPELSVPGAGAVAPHIDVLDDQQCTIHTTADQLRALLRHSAA